MSTEQPSYREHTRASLSRARIPFRPQPVETIPDTSQLEQRRKIASVRIDVAERKRRLVPPSQRWPTVNSVRAYKESLVKPTVGKVTIKQSPQRAVRIPFSGSSSTLSPPIDSSNSSSDFPFLIRKFKGIPTFPQFRLLPGELRIQIWKEAFLAPKFIELQFYSDESKAPLQIFSSPIFSPPKAPQILNYQPYDTLLSVCLESREVAQALSAGRKLRYLNIVEDGWTRMSHLNPRMEFIPERDTIFFRPMDYSMNNRLRSIPPNFGGHLICIEHVAIPLDLKKPTPCALYWTHDIRAFPKLKTLTFMLGCAEKSWIGDPLIELREMEHWFADGRKRTLDIDVEHRVGWQKKQFVEGEGWLDVAALSAFVAKCAVPNRPLAVRVVAWKRKQSE